MKKNNSTIQLLFLALVISLAAGFGCGPKWTEEDMGDFRLVRNRGGQTLGYSLKSGVTITYDKGFAFKDLNKNGKLDIYEDWRKPVNERAKDLASKMTIEQIAGLMLYSGHQSIPAQSGRFNGGMYKGKPFEESGAKASDLTDAQIKFLIKDNLRHVLITQVEAF